MDAIVSLVILLLVSGAGASKHADLPAEPAVTSPRTMAPVEYWQAVLPETPMPQAIHDLLTQSTDDSRKATMSYGSGSNDESRKVTTSYESQGQEDSRKVTTSYASQGEDSRKVTTSYRSQVDGDSRKVTVSYGSQGKEDSRKTATSYRSQGENSRKVTTLYVSQNDGDSRKVTMSYGTQGVEDSRKVTTSYGSQGEHSRKVTKLYGSQGEIDSRKVTMSYGSLGEELSKVTTSYGSQGEDSRIRMVSTSYGSHGEDSKKVTTSYRSQIERDSRKVTTSYGSQVEDSRKVTASYDSQGKDHSLKITISNSQRSGGEKGEASEGHIRHDHAHSHNDGNKLADVFFFQDVLRPGSMITPTIPPTTSLPTLLPRREADSLPFSTKRLDDILAMFAPMSLAMADEIRWTLDTCEHPRPLPGEKAGCATSLESLAKLPAALLGTRDVHAFSGDMPIDPAGTTARRGRHKVTAVRKLSESPVAAACHDLTYPYTVFYCHTASPAAAYMVTLAAEDGGSAAPEMEALAVCHLDTSQWSPRHPFLVAHNLRPGDVAVCHFLSKLSMIWVPAGEQGGARDAR
ncbi:unnamed protein product [Urochloa decumbens]|uniref:BURP domain-containing protein n=1 Tax=Urochloa decumbens TaxID=240449 RepID=A0ABC8Z5Z1_9POAL